MNNLEALKIIEERIDLGKKEYMDTASEYIEALQLAAYAIREVIARPPKMGKPLTQAELRMMHGEKVWCEELNMEVEVNAPNRGYINVHYRIPSTDGWEYAKDLTLYRCKKGEEHGQRDYQQIDH